MPRAWVLPFDDLAVLKGTYARLLIYTPIWTSPKPLSCDLEPMRWPTANPGRPTGNSLMVNQEGFKDGARTLRLVSREDVARTGEDFQACAGEDGSHAT